MTSTPEALETVRILSIDPSINRCGWALATFQAQEGPLIPVLKADGTFELQGTPDQWNENTSRWAWGYFDTTCRGYVARLKELVEYIMMEVGEFDVLIGEWPEFYDSTKGHAAAMRGDTINLAGIVCYIAGYFRLNPKHINFLTAPRWKGSVSKEITRQQFYRSFGIQKHYTIDHNAVDAAMMLLTWCQRMGVVSKFFANAPKHIDHAKMPKYLGTEHDAHLSRRPIRG
jgi:hypothetical protein